MQSKLLSIGQAAKLLGVSIDTLRRWDASGRLRSIRSGPRGHRFFKSADIEYYLQEVDIIARNWAESTIAFEPNPEVYCQTRDIFQARLEKFQSVLIKIAAIETVSLITAIAGEIGNNSFDHNLGNWPDITGIFFSFDINKRQIALADRGQGVLRTLKRVRPDIKNDEEALLIAFTEVVSGRNPEARGNGLKFVLEVVLNNPIELEFYSGGAKAFLDNKHKDIKVSKTEVYYSGCLALIKF